MSLSQVIKNEYATCKACGKYVTKRTLLRDGYVWQCECGWTQRIWSCSKEYYKALEKHLNSEASNEK